MTDQTTSLVRTAFGALFAMACSLPLLDNTTIAQDPPNMRHPQMGNRLLQVQRDQVASALGESHPKVLSLNARCELEGGKHSSLKPLRKTETTSPESQMGKIMKRYNQLQMQNAKLKREIEELASSEESVGRN